MLALVAAESDAEQLVAAVRDGPGTGVRCHVATVVPVGAAEPLGIGVRRGRGTRRTSHAATSRWGRHARPVAARDADAAQAFGDAPEIAG